MYICHCRAVTDRTIAAAVASGARSIDDLARRCGAGSRCGGCWPALRELLDEAGLPSPLVAHGPRRAHHSAA